MFPGLVKFVPAVAYHFSLNLPEAFSQPGNGLLEVPCTHSKIERLGWVSITFCFCALQLWQSECVICSKTGDDAHPTYLFSLAAWS